MGRGAVEEPSSAEAPEKKGPWGWVWKMDKGPEEWKQSSVRWQAWRRSEHGWLARGLVKEFGLGT